MSLYVFSAAYCFLDGWALLFGATITPFAKVLGVIMMVFAGALIFIGYRHITKPNRIQGNLNPEGLKVSKNIAGLTLLLLRKSGANSGLYNFNDDRGSLEVSVSSRWIPALLYGIKYLFLSTGGPNVIIEHHLPLKTTGLWFTKCYEIDAFTGAYKSINRENGDRSTQVQQVVNVSGSRPQDRTTDELWDILKLLMQAQFLTVPSSSRQ